MTDEIRVNVASYGTGRCLMMVYFDPVSGKKIARTSKTKDPTEAAKKAGVWQDELNTGRYHAPAKTTWAEFRRRYEEEKLASLAENTFDAATTALNHLERVLRLSKLTAGTLSRFQAKLRAEDMKDSTIACYLRHLKAAISWAESMGLIHKRPRIDMPQRAKGAKMMHGRPITTEEYERMLAAADKSRPHDADQWKRYMTGLWLSGLRLEESLVLSWDQDSPFCVCLTGRFPTIRIYAEAEKGHKDRLLPMTPDFAEWLLATPEAERHGPVFALAKRETGGPLTLESTSRIISRIGEKAGVVVNRETKWVNEEVTDPRTGKPTGEKKRVRREVPKFASAHDFRRAFGTRWAPRVKPPTLRLLMRHTSIETTLRYYVDQDADDVASELWATWGSDREISPKQFGNTRGNTQPDYPQNQGRKAR
ncbi:MAG: tyrosine-type recombinase/integrase [Planctomycetia bacterium]|nr:tyrosine-type recombinase/integrase [Planctomycetia bacterium]